MATVKRPKFEHTLLFHYHIPGDVRGQTLNRFARLKSKGEKVRKNQNVQKLTEMKGEINNLTIIVVDFKYPF